MKKLTIILIAILSVVIPKLSYDLIQEDRLVKGIVIDKDTKEPILFGNIWVVGTKVGTQTDLKGRFEISVPNGYTKLEASYIGYKSVVVEIGTKDSITIEISSATVSLNEILVKEYKKPLIISNTSSTNVIGSRSDGKNYYIDGIRINAEAGNQNSNDQIQNFNTEDYDYIQENIFHSPLTAPLSTFSIDVDGSSYSNMRRFLDYGQQPPKDAVRIEELVNYFDYEYEQPSDEHPFSFTTEMSDCPWQPKHK